MTEDQWRARFTEFGHTGWRNPFLYKLDQKLRKRIINSALRKFPPKFTLFGCGTNALDFGCGRGDFLQVLHGHYWYVAGCDILPEARVAVAKQRYDALAPDAALSRPWSLILSVTVLQHFGPCDRHDWLVKMRKALEHDGRIVLLENSNLIDWPKALQDAGLTITHQEHALCLPRGMKLMIVENQGNGNREAKGTPRINRTNRSGEIARHRCSASWMKTCRSFSQFMMPHSISSPR